MDPLPDGDNEVDEMLASLQAFERAHALAEIFCPEKPEALLHAPIGMYHCPDCGVMVVAGAPHPPVKLFDDGRIDYSFL